MAVRSGPLQNELERSSRAHEEVPHHAEYTAVSLVPQQGKLEHAMLAAAIVTLHTTYAEFFWECFHHSERQYITSACETGLLPFYSDGWRKEHS